MDIGTLERYLDLHLDVDVPNSLLAFKTMFISNKVLTRIEQGSLGYLINIFQVRT